MRHHPCSTRPARICVAIARASLCCALGLASMAQAQTLDDAYAAGTIDPNAPSAYAGSAPKAPSPRAIFVTTIAALVAQGLGSGIGNALSEGLGGAIAKWFHRAPSVTDMRPRPTSTRQPKSDQQLRAGLHAGLAFEIHQIGRDGSSLVVDPASHVFRTGDRFEVYYRPTLPGRVNVFNVNPQGRESRIDAVEVAAGQLATLGPYQFVDATGVETLKLVLEPCSSPALTAATRAIVRTGAASTHERPAAQIGACDDERTRSLRAKTRSIRKTTVEGSTAFALDPLSEEEVRSGFVGPRSLQIALQHR